MLFVISRRHAEEGVDEHGDPPGGCGDARAAMKSVADVLGVPVTDLTVAPFRPRGADTYLPTESFPNLDE
jgi:hypothetical protein